MKMTDKHELTELGITIGRRINIRTNAQGQRVEQVSRNYTAEYSDADGNYYSIRSRSNDYFN